MEFFKKYKKHYIKPFLAAIVCLTVEAMCDLLQPTIMSKVIDVGVLNKDSSYVLKFGAIMLGITLIGAISAITRNFLSSNVSQKFAWELRGDMFKKMNQFSFEDMDKFDKASLVTRITNDVTQLQNFFNGLMRIFVKAPLLCLGSIIMAIRLNMSMALIIIMIIPIIVVLIAINMKISYPFYTKIQSSIDKVNGVMREYLSGVRVVKAFNRFKYENKRFEKENEDLSDVSIKAMRISALFSPSITLTVNLGIVALLWFGGIKVSDGTIKVGQIMAFINYMTQILFSLMMISFVFTMFVRAKASFKRVEEVLNGAGYKEYCGKEEILNKSNGKIEFENVHFSYDGEDVLNNITFQCKEGEKVGIIGATGSGKTTLVNLISKFYLIKSGTIKIDGCDIKSLNEISLRNNIGMVPQKNLLFTGTVKENICFGKKDASYEEVIEASKVACANEFIEKLANGYDTYLGQGGVNLSGGQKQRIAIARALIKKPSILILDDCTSAVDANTERKIKESLNTYLKGTTCIIIAQRVTSVMDLDKIIVLDKGEIVGIGKHKELIENCNIYMDIFKSQVGKEMM